jgi:hypothetical protein
MVNVTKKNLGPTIMETAVYINRGLTDHLLNMTNYRELSETEALALNEVAYQLILKHWTDDPTMDPNSHLYFKTSRLQRHCSTERRPPVPVLLCAPQSAQDTLENTPSC